MHGQLENLPVSSTVLTVAIGFLGNIGSADTAISYFLIDTDPITEQTKIPKAIKNIIFLNIQS